jgi:hypothetical protein
MPKVIDAARVSVKHDAVWRVCAGCGALAALAPEVTHCPACAPDPAEQAAVAFTSAELAAARAVLAGFCRGARTPHDRVHAVYACLTGYLGAVVTAAAAGEPVESTMRKAAALYAVREQVIA